MEILRKSHLIPKVEVKKNRTFCVMMSTEQGHVSFLLMSLIFLTGSCNGEVSTTSPSTKKVFEASACAVPSFWSPVSFTVATSSNDDGNYEQQKPVLPLLVKRY